MQLCFCLKVLFSNVVVDGNGKNVDDIGLLETENVCVGRAKGKEIFCEKNFE